MKTKCYLLVLTICMCIGVYAQETTNERSKQIVDSLELKNVESKTNFKGGDKSWSKYLENNINYEVPYYNSAPIGVYQVRVKFIIFEDGHIGEVKALSRHGYGMEKEVVRVIKASPNWTTAYQNGKYVMVDRTQLVTFRVTTD